MRAKTIFGAMLLSVVVCSQGFGGEMAARLLGLERFDGSCYSPCGTCQPACEPAGCCDTAACEKPCRFPVVCTMFARLQCCGKPECCEAECSVPKCCAPKCCEADCGDVCKPRWTPVRDLLDDVKVALFCRRCLTDCGAGDCGCTSGCDTGCGYSSACDNNAAPSPAPTKAENSPTPAPKAGEEPAPVPVPDAAPIPPAPGK